MRRAALLAVALMAVRAVSAAEWTRISSPDFELYTSAGEKQGRETILLFERVHDFFQRASPLRDISVTPVRIIQFSSAEEYSHYRPNDFSLAYFTPSERADYIVMGDAAQSHEGTAVHEYMHLAIRHSGIQLPLWLNEGWAEVYSTLRAMGKETLVGDLIQQHIDRLNQEQWLDFDTLTSADQRSPVYQEGARAAVFYSESWALVHMLSLSPAYQQGFGKFVTALAAGKSAAEACEIGFGRSSAEVFRDLRNYFDQKKLYGRAFETKFSLRNEAINASVVTDFDAQLMLADLLLALNRLNEAQAAYTELERTQPVKAELAESLGFLALRNRDTGTARQQFAKAFDGGDSNPVMCYQLARLEGAARQPAARIIAILERAVKGGPSFADARLELGLAYVGARQFARAIDNLMAMPDVTPDRAPRLFCGLAYAYLESGDLSSARRHLDTCQKWSKSDAEKKFSDGLTKLMDARSTGPGAMRPGERWQRVSGTLRTVACTPRGNYLSLNTVRGEISLYLPPSEAVEVERNGAPTTEITCGRQDSRNIIVEYAPGDREGIVRRIQFQ